MNRQPHRILPAALLIAATGVAPLSTLSAQDAQPPAAPAPAAQPATPSRPTPPPAPARPTPPRERGPASSFDAMPLFSFDFSGGTLSQFVAAVKSHSPQPINAVFPAEAAKLEVPALSLKNVTAFVALQSLEYSTKPGPTQNIQVSAINMAMGGRTLAEGEAPTFAIRIQGVPQPNIAHGTMQSPFGSPAAVTRVYSVRELLPVEGGSPLPGLTIDQVVQPIQTALTVDLGDVAEGAEARTDEPKIMVHKESNLVIVRGNQRQVELARQVLDRLREDVETLRDRGRAEREFDIALKEVRASHKAEEAAAERLLVNALEQQQRMAKQLEMAQKERPEEKTFIGSLQKRFEDAERYATNAAHSLDRLKAQAGSEEVTARKLAAERTRMNTEAQYLRTQIEELRKQIEDLKATKGSGSR